MRAAGRVVAQTLLAVQAAAVPGVRLRELDELAQTAIREAGALPSFLGYRPAWAPTSFNGSIVDGWHGDAAVTVHVGEVLEDDARLLQATGRALAAGIAAAVPGATLLDVATAVDDVARAHGYAHLPDHGGHGIGRAMHEAPFVPNEPTPDAGRHRLRAGNTIAIEPMLHAGTRDSRYRTKKDGWSIVTTDGKRAAHFEHTVAVTDDGPEILTAVAASQQP